LFDDLVEDIASKCLYFEYSLLRRIDIVSDLLDRSGNEILSDFSIIFHGPKSLFSEIIGNSLFEECIQSCDDFGVSRGEILGSDGSEFDQEAITTIGSHGEKSIVFGQLEDFGKTTQEIHKFTQPNRLIDITFV
jgi:hypothetical protein